MSQPNMWLVLSDGAKPTEDIYFLESAAPSLRQQGVGVERVVAQRFFAAARLHGRALLRRYAGANVVICRSLAPSWVSWLKRHRHWFGYIAYLIDDDIAAAAEDTALPAAYRQRMAGIAKRQPALLELCDEVVACSDVLAARFLPLHQRVSVLPPPLIAPLPALEHFEQPPSRQKPWQMGFHGTRAHLNDLLHITPSLWAVLNVRQDLHCEVMLGQYTPVALTALENNSTPEPLPWHSFRHYQASKRLHIGLAPLLQTPFNEGKSFIKFLDIAAMGGVGIYSNRYPYTEVVRHGENGLLVGDTPGEWRAALQQLLNNSEATANMAQQAAADALRVGALHHAVDFWQARQR
ncbi:glycosyltransferase family 1 protein [Halomonas meridiana]|uniref:glycosyltransferase n=1 Tax=Vreelandella aquamarina TaxID=77097 RepID=UPI00273BAF67|nr:glycosyltransferase family 1 protein [Halomonas meridiana]MDP4556233.1 glycosyltransferase family 1 protein [Halomonas meridiana]